LHCNPEARSLKGGCRFTLVHGSAFGGPIPSRASSWFRSLRKRESQDCRAKPAMIAQHVMRENTLSMRHLRLTVHDSQTTKELGVERDDNR
jgi:hypothetical protein